MWSGARDAAALEKKKGNMPVGTSVFQHLMTFWLA
jgi:hypothetical protein